jgi:hypothetical protein
MKTFDNEWIIGGPMDVPSFADVQSDSAIVLFATDGA